MGKKLYYLQAEREKRAKTEADRLEAEAIRRAIQDRQDANDRKEGTPWPH